MKHDFKSKGHFDVKVRGVFLLSVFLLLGCGTQYSPEDKQRTETKIEPWWKTEVQQFVRPPGKKIIKTLLDRNSKNRHPRLLINDELINNVMRFKEKDVFIKKCYDDVISQADELLTVPSQQNKVSRHLTIDRIFPLGLACQLTKKKKYFDRAWNEMEAVASVKEWNETGRSDFLCTSYVSRGMALGYDWFYNEMTPEQRKIVREAIVNKALKPGQISYKNPNGNEYAQHHWINGKHNWNPTCNGSLAIAAMAIGDEEPELAGYVLEQGLLSIEHYLTEFGPDGAWKEGVGYWYWATASLVLYIASLESVLGTDYNLSAAQGLDQTGNFPVYMEGTEGVFNYADSPVTSRLSPEILFLANRFKNKVLATGYCSLMTSKNRALTPRDILYYDFGKPFFNQEIGLPLTRSFGRIEGFSFRSSWIDTAATFIACKGGYNSEVHGTLSTGTFVFDAMGVRWAHQIGAGNYSGKDGFWDYGEKGKRWTFYRCRAEGQNSLVVNPDSVPDQYPKAVSKLIAYKSNDELPGGYGIIDMKEAYKKDALSAVRGVYMPDDASYVVIQDELRLREPSDVYWFMHTRAEMMIDPDGKVATLYESGKSLKAILLSDNDGSRFVVMPARKLPSSPAPKRIKPEKDNSEYKKLTVLTRNVTELNQAVVLVVSNDSMGYEWKRLNEWNRAF